MRVGSSAVELTSALNLPVGGLVTPIYSKVLTDLVCQEITEVFFNV